jgi:glucuronate isomerase
MSSSAAAIFDDDFLLETDAARRLYHEHAKLQPIIDYHCHLSPEQIAKNHRFTSMTELWLAGDHYKWRAMRTHGVPERLCTGDGSDWEKFAAWAETVPYTLRNPLYHWTHLELKSPFGLRHLLDPSSAREIYEHTNRRLGEESFKAQGLLRHFRVLVVCTTDDPVDTLEHHAAHARSEAAREVRLYPTWRPDQALGIEELASFNAWVDALAAVTGMDIGSYDALLTALDRRHAFFHDQGCRLSDRGLETVPIDDLPLESVRTAFERARRGQSISRAEANGYRAALLYELSLMDHRRGWVQQFHLGAMRNNNTRMTGRLGPNTGFDSIGEYELGRPLARFLDRLDRTDQLAKTILYNSNPKDNELFATMIGNFQDGTVAGKMQYGSAWWFLDQLEGMTRQLEALSNMSLLSHFVGMLTDSRSFLSYSRHEYFRRLLCNLVGHDVRRGLLPEDYGLLGRMVRDVAFRNARAYFGLELPDQFVAGAG